MTRRMFLIFAGLLMTSQSGFAQTSQQALNNAAPQPSIVDYGAFLNLSEEVMAYRESRLIGKQKFAEMASMDDVIILDTRSKFAFDQGHVKGAVHLNFSDFTQDKLDKLIGDKSRPILIYCNNNFAENTAPFPLKRAELALNIPTFINLYGYGFENIYELGETVSMHDPALNIVSSAQ